MVRNPNEAPALRLAGLAVVLVMSGLAPTLQPVAAQVDLSYLAGPYFEEGIPASSCGQGRPMLLARPASNETQVAQMQVRLGGGAVNSVQFIYELAPDPGSSTAPGLSKALKWNASVSSAGGWSPPVANNDADSAGGRRSLTFTGGLLAGSASSPGVVFTIAFEIPSNAQGTRSGGTPDSFPIKISAGGTTAQSAFCIRMDDKAPKPLVAITRDYDFDGRLDTIELTFDEALHPDTLVPGEFDVRVPGADKPYFVLTTSPELSKAPCGFSETLVDVDKIREITPVSEPSSQAPCPRRVILKLAPGATFDTGFLPNITYPAAGTNGTLTDLAGNKLPPITVGAVPTFDGAKPVMVSALAKEGSDKIFVTFSEPVRGSGKLAAGTPQGTPRPVRVDSDVCTGGDCSSDFIYIDLGYPNCVPASSGCVGIGDCVGKEDQVGRNMPPMVTGATHNPTGPSASQVIINLGAGTGAATHRYPKAWGDPDSNGWTPPANGFRGCTNGQFGAGDTHRTHGDLLGLTLDSLPVNDCRDSRNGLFDFAPCDRIIRDESGLRAVAYKGLAASSGGDFVPAVTVSGPYATEAEINIDSFRLTLRFNGPVTSVAGDNVGIRLSDLDIVSADDSGQGPSGIVAINHTAGSDTAILTLDHRTRATDVDNTPAKVRISCAAGQGVKSFGQQILVPCYDPDADLIADIVMRDLTPPAFTPPNLFTPAISTVDANGNGYIDGLKVHFSEPVDDASFCLGPVIAGDAQPSPPYPPGKRPPLVCTSDGFVDTGGNPQGAQACQNPDTHSLLVISNTPGPYTWDTDLLPDDNQGIIRFPELAGRLQRTDETPHISTNPCWAKEGYGHWCTDPSRNYCHGADRFSPGPNPVLIERKWTDWGVGLFTDKAHPYPESPAYLAANKMKRVCGNTFGVVDGLGCFEGNGITAKTFDGAPPALWSARTIDTPSPGIHCNTADVTGCQGNGRIDGYVLTFSEPVNDCTFFAGEWKVAGHTVTGMRTNLLLDQPQALCPYPADARLVRSGQGDNVLVLLFDEGREPDTDAKPELTYAGPSCNSCGLRDLSGNAMRSVGTLTLTEEDDAGPVITCVRGFVGRSEVEVEFSEPVDNGDRGGLPRTAFLYANGNGLQSGATGIAGTSPVRHQAGDRIAIVTLNANLVAGDLLNDTIGANVHTIHEVAPTVAAKKVVSTVPRHLRDCPGIDKVPPANVTGLQVVQGLVSANSVTLEWTAPGNDGNGLGNVTGYLVKVSTSAITPGNFFNSQAPGTVAVLETDQARDPDGCPPPANVTAGATQEQCVPPCVNESVAAASGAAFGSLRLIMDPEPCSLAHPGQTQRARITGLRPETTYHFAVVAFDNATADDGTGKIVPSPNPSGIGSPVSVKTGRDATPPAWQRVVYTDVPAFGVTKNTRPVFNWHEATDAESDVTYFVALNQELEYNVDPAKDLETSATTFTPSQALPTGRWSIHVAAYSGGGGTQTAHYTVYVGAGPVDANAIQNANELISTKAFRLGDAHIINWTLPSQEDLRRYVPGGELEAIQVVRLTCASGEDGCQREVAHTQRGNYTTLQNGSWTDDNATALTSQPYYRVEMVFSGGQTQEPSVRGFVEPQDITPRQSPLVPLIGIILLAAVLAALVSWAIIASRARAAKTQAAEEAPAGVDQETGLPTHDVRCPSCSTPFQAVGALPLQITCPNCGVSGMLQ